jgi:putative phosphoesterase
MLKIGVIADTHWNSLSQAHAGAQKLVNGVFADVDAIIHAGDMLHPEVDLAFAPYKFYAVRGNMDAADAHTPLKRILTFDAIKIGVIHGWGGGTEIEVNAAS